jgi:hypothetical protein
VFFTWSLKQGPRQVIEQVFDVAIIDAPSAEQAVESRLPDQTLPAEKGAT